MANEFFEAGRFDNQHKKNMNKTLRDIAKIFETFFTKASLTASTTGYRTKPGDEYHLSDYPMAQKKIESYLRSLSIGVVSSIQDGNERAWQLSNDKGKQMVSQVAKRAKIAPKDTKAWTPRNIDGLSAFNDRVVNGMNLSERVWKRLAPMREQLELSMELGIGQGKSAAELSRDVRKSLKNPDALFRRVRDEKGNLYLSKRAESYHTGRGVYRSAYKNAMRMTVTENNQAYRTADYENWQGMPFVIGIRIHTSNNHPIADVCDELAGDYPKDFKFTGWHPFCRCFAVPIMADKEDSRRWMSATDEERANFKWKGEVKEMPKNFNNWVDNNAERIAKAKSMPSFIKDNANRVVLSIKDNEKSNVAADMIASSFDELKGSKSSKYIGLYSGQNVISDEQITEATKSFVMENSKLFPFKITEFRTIDEYSAFGLTTYKKDGRTIGLSKGRWDIMTDNGVVVKYIPRKNYEMAFLNGFKKMSIEEENGVAAFWHELNHAMNLGWKNRGLYKQDSPESICVELSNELRTRLTYHKYVSAMGGKTSHRKQIIENGFGYNGNMTNFYSMLERAGISKRKAMIRLDNSLRTKYGEEMTDEVYKIFSKTKLTRKDFDNLIDNLYRNNDYFCTLLDGKF